MTPMGIRTLIIGAGGNAQVIAEALLSPTFKRDGYELVGFLDDDPDLLSTQILGRPVFGPVSALKDVLHDVVIIGIGDNKTRLRIFHQLSAFGEEFATFIHPSAVVSPSVKIGKGTAVFKRVIINTGAIIEDNVILRSGCTVGHHCYVASHSYVSAGACLGGGVKIGKGVVIGLGSSVLQNITIGEWATVEPKAAVIRDIAAQTTVAGVPAEVVSSTTESDGRQFPTMF